MGDNSQAEFYSVAVTNNHQEADTGTKMIHLGKNTRSTIISKGISAGKSQTLTWFGESGPEGRWGTQLFVVRLAPSGRSVRCTHFPLH